MLISVRFRQRDRPTVRHGDHRYVTCSYCSDPITLLQPPPHRAAAKFVEIGVAVDSGSLVYRIWVNNWITRPRRRSIDRQIDRFAINEQQQRTRMQRWGGSVPEGGAFGSQSLEQTGNQPRRFLTPFTHFLIGERQHELTWSRPGWNAKTKPNERWPIIDYIWQTTSSLGRWWRWRRHSRFGRDGCLIHTEWNFVRGDANSLRRQPQPAD